MLSDSEDKMIDLIIRQQGLSEENCLWGLTEQQRKVWVHYAVLGKSEQEILETVFGRRKNATLSTVRYVLQDAQLRIMANILREWDLVQELQKRPRARAAIKVVIDRVQELKNRKGAKVKCRRSQKTN